MSRLLDPKKGQRRQKYEFCVVLCVRASTWKDGLLSRFTADDKRMEEGKGKAEEALKAMRDAGLTIKVKKHSTKDGSRLLMVFVTAELVRVRARVRVRVGVGVGVGVGLPPGCARGSTPESRRATHGRRCRGRAP